MYARFSPISFCALFAVLSYFGCSASVWPLTPAPPPLPQFDLKAKIGAAPFPGYLSAALANFKSGDSGQCLSQLKATKLSNYSDEPEKYYLLLGACSVGAGQNEDAVKAVQAAVAEKGSRSDLLYLLGLVSSAGGNQELARKRLEEALWFESYKVFSKQETLAALGAIELASGLADQGKAHLDSANVGPTATIEVKMVLATLAMQQGDRKKAIEKARDAVASGGDVRAQELLMRALSVNADPMLHKHDILEAAGIASKLPKESFTDPETSYAGIRALLLSGKNEEAVGKLKIALKANPADPKLADIADQIKAEATASAASSVASE